MNTAISAACGNYRAYVANILSPATSDFLTRVSKNAVSLHDVFGTNLFVAHAVDYIQAIRTAAGIKESRISFVKSFDERFGVVGSRFQSRKFELVDAINCALKHIQLDEERYKSLVKSYGSISFNCLIPQDGRVTCLLAGYRFDYSRVILRPAIQALSGCEFEDAEDVLNFARGDVTIESISSLGDWDDPIDQMIAHCNPNCDDCDEPEEDCLCSTFVYDGERGFFAPNSDPNFDFDEVMSRISGAYRKNG